MIATCIVYNKNRAYKVLVEREVMTCSLQARAFSTFTPKSNIATIWTNSKVASLINKILLYFGKKYFAPFGNKWSYARSLPYFFFYSTPLILNSFMLLHEKSKSYEKSVVWIRGALTYQMRSSRWKWSLSLIISWFGCPVDEINPCSGSQCINDTKFTQWTENIWHVIFCSFHRKLNVCILAFDYITVQQWRSSTHHKTESTCS